MTPKFTFQPWYIFQASVMWDSYRRRFYHLKVSKKKTHLCFCHPHSQQMHTNAKQLTNLVFLLTFPLLMTALLIKTPRLKLRVSYLQFFFDSHAHQISFQIWLKSPSFLPLSIILFLPALHSCIPFTHAILSPSTTVQMWWQVSMETVQIFSLNPTL